MSTLRVNAIVDASGGNTATINTFMPPAPVRAWVNFNGSGTVAIRASLNVTSITDNGAGDYTINFTTALSDANYGFNLSCQGAGAGNTLIGVEQHQGTTPTASAIRVLVKQNNTSLDRDYVCASIFR
jgi:endoglucanase Acf2